MKKLLRNLSGGLVLHPPTDLLPEGRVVSNRGLNSMSRGSFRSRPGSDLLAALDAHSITYFANLYWLGVSTFIYRSGVQIVTGLDGNRLSFQRCPPVAGITDYLFVCGGGTNYKIDSAGNETDWGFAAPITGPGSTSAAGGALEADASYQYKVTYKNSTTGHRSNANTTATEETPTGANLTVSLSAIPDGSLVDSQIDKVEIWRTVADGTVFFYLDEVNAGTTVYADNGSVLLSAIQLPTDNLQPYDYFEDCLGPHNASMFWLTRSQAGQRGRVFYSPVGRCESLAGWIEVTADDNPLQKLFRYNGQLGVIAEAGIFLIGGANPYVVREIAGCPGTVHPHSIAVTPNGVYYVAADGVRRFDGARSHLIAPGTIERLFRGESAGDLSAFSGTLVGMYARDEYFISDGSQTLAINIMTEQARDIGIGLTALYYSEESDQAFATFNSKLVDLEKIGEVQDDTTNISVILEIAEIDNGSEHNSLVQYVTFDYNSNSEDIAATLIYDDATQALGTLSNAARGKTTIAAGKEGKRFGIRLTSTAGAEIEIFGIKLENYEAEL